jgi:hypothetical protein
MSCCQPPRHGEPFDPACEGPQERDLERFGEADYTLDELGVGDEQPEEPVALRKTWTAVAALLALVAFVVVFIL